MIQRKRLWRFHKYRDNEDFCPLCYAPVRWIFDREKDMWCPCDESPAMYITDKNGTQVDIYSRWRKPIKAVLYNSWDKRFTPDKVKYGYVPHVYTCEVLTNEN